MGFLHLSTQNAMNTLSSQMNHMGPFNVDPHKLAHQFQGEIDALFEKLVLHSEFRKSYPDLSKHYITYRHIADFDGLFFQQGIQTIHDISNHLSSYYFILNPIEKAIADIAHALIPNSHFRPSNPQNMEARAIFLIQEVIIYEEQFETTKTCDNVEILLENTSLSLRLRILKALSDKEEIESDYFKKKYNIARVQVQCFSPLISSSSTQTRDESEEE